MYSTLLAHAHDTGFAAFSERASPSIARLVGGAGAVVEIGCGSGILARHLSDAGHRVLGVDISAAMIRIARARAPRAQFKVAGLSSVAIPRCDAIVAIGEVVTYVEGGLPALRAFFARAHRALRPGGVLIFDFIESARRRTFATRTFQGEDWTMAVRAAFDERTGILTRRMAIVRQSGRQARRSNETHRVRVYQRAAIVSALGECGFAVRAGRSFGRCRLMAGGVAVVARKKPRI